MPPASRPLDDGEPAGPHDGHAVASADNEQSWLALTATGDRVAFTRLFDAMSPRVFGLLRRVIKNRALAEETMQEVFLEVWSKARTFDPSKGAAETWVLTISHRRAIDCVRRTGASTARDYRIGIRDHEAETPDAADEVHQRASARRVIEAVAQLNPKQRRFLTLAYYGGHSQSEIATLTATPLGTVKTTMRAGLTALSGLLLEPTDGPHQSIEPTDGPHQPVEPTDGPHQPVEQPA